MEYDCEERKIYNNLIGVKRIFAPKIEKVLSNREQGDSSGCPNPSLKVSPRKDH